MTIQELYDKKGYKFKLKLLAGREGLNYDVSKIYYLEDLSICDWTRSGELLITTGMMTRQDPDWLLKFVKNVHTFKPSGILVNTGGYLKEIPDNVIDYCNQVALPVFSFPWEIVLQDIITEITNYLYEEDQLQHNLAKSLVNLIFAPEQTQNYEPCLKSSGVLMHTVYQVVLFQVKDDPNAQSILKRYVSLRFPNSIIAFYEYYLICVLTDEDVTNAKKELDGFIKEWNSHEFGIGIKINMGSVVSDCYQLSQSFQDAELCMRISTGNDHVVNSYDALGIWGILATSNQKLLKEYCKNKLQLLLAHDENSGSEYLTTLKQYIDAECNISQVAEDMYIHKNTVSYRLRKIKEITGEDITLPHVLMEYKLALMGLQICAE